MNQTQPIQPPETQEVQVDSTNVVIISNKEKPNSVKFQSRMLMAAITGIEFLNNKLYLLW